MKGHPKNSFDKALERNGMSDESSAAPQPAAYHHILGYLFDGSVPLEKQKQILEKINSPSNESLGGIQRSETMSSNQDLPGPRGTNQEADYWQSTQANNSRHEIKGKAVNKIDPLSWAINDASVRDSSPFFANSISPALSLYSNGLEMGMDLAETSIESFFSLQENREEPGSSHWDAMQSNPVQNLLIEDGFVNQVLGINTPSILQLPPSFDPPPELDFNSLSGLEGLERPSLPSHPSVLPNKQEDRTMYKSEPAPEFMSQIAQISPVSLQSLTDGPQKKIGPQLVTLSSEEGREDLMSSPKRKRAAQLVDEAGWRWRKQGQKSRKDGTSRSYYRCSSKSSGCTATLMIDNKGPTIDSNSSWQPKGEHNHLPENDSASAGQKPLSLQVDDATATSNDTSNESEG